MQFVIVTFVARPACSERRISETNLRANRQTSTLLNYFAIRDARVTSIQLAKLGKRRCLGMPLLGILMLECIGRIPEMMGMVTLSSLTDVRFKGGLMESHLSRVCTECEAHGERARR